MASVWHMVISGEICTQIQQYRKCRMASTTNIGDVKICIGHHLLKFKVNMSEVLLRIAFDKTVVRTPIVQRSSSNSPSRFSMSILSLFSFFIHLRRKITKYISREQYKYKDLLTSFIRIS